MLNDAGPRDGGEDEGHASQHVPRAHDPLELLLVVDAVLDGENSGVRADDGKKRLGRALRVEGLDAEEDEVGGRRAVETLDGGRRHRPASLGGGGDGQSSRLDGPQMLAAGHKGDVLSRPRELGAEVPARAARSHDDDPHLALRSVRPARGMDATLRSTCPTRSSRWPSTRPPALASCFAPASAASGTSPTRAAPPIS